MAEKISIPTTDNPTRGQSSLTGNVRFRNISGVEDAGYITIGTVTKVFYDKGTLDFSLGGVGDYNSLENISGSGSAPIPVDFWGYNSNNKPFGHYRSVKSGDKVAIAFIDGKVAKPIVIGVYPSDEASYELINPVGYDTADDSSQEVENDVLGDKKVYSNQQIFYRSGAGDILRTLNGHSFMEISDNTEDFLSDIQHNYDSLAGVMLQNGTEVNPETETAQAWLLVHEDNPEADDGDTHRTRFYVNKQGAFQLVFMDTSDESTPVSILEGSKDNGFTLTKRYDNNVLDENSTDYVTLNVGDKDTKSFMVEAASEVDSKAQSSTLEVNSSGIFVNGQNLIDYINSVAKVSQDDINNAIPNSPDFQKLKDDTEAAGKAAADAAEQAKQAGEDAKQAGINAEQAGEDAKAQAQDIKDKIIYYTSISPEQDVYVPGKYLIVNTDTYIADGTIKNAYIEDASIDHAKIASEAVGESQIEDLAVTRAKIANLAVGSAQIEDLAVTDEKVGTLSFDHMIGSTLDATQINVVNLSGDSINAGTITADRLIIRSLGDITDDLGKIHNGEINVNPDPDNPNSGGGVDINGLPADNPDSYTPYKKSLLKAQIAVLEAQADAAISYGQSTNNDSTAVNTAKTNLLNGTATLLTDMNTTTKFDHTQIDSWVTALQTAISNFQNASLNTINASIGTTADGKNSISMGTQEPANPHVGDLFLKKQTDGTYDLEIYTENGWVSPALQAIQNVANQVAKLPKNYYTPDQPAGTDYNDGDKWYKNSTDKDGNIVYTEYKWDATKKQWIPMMNNGEVDNADQIAQIKNSTVGNNLLVGTGTPITITGSNANNQTTGSYFFPDSQTANDISTKYGSTFTLSYDWSVTGSTIAGRFYPQCNGVPWSTNIPASTQITVGNTNKSGHISATYSLASNTANIATGLQFRLDNFQGTLTISHMKLEAGKIATDWSLSQQELVSTSGNYAGVAINDKGITALAGSSSIYLSNTHGFEIQKSGSDIFHVDTSGNLTMQGDITAGNISGVNFTGNNSTLAGTLAVNGAISAAGGNVVLSSSGLAIKGGNLTIADSSGNTTTYVQADGTFVTKKGIFSGSITSSNITVTGGDINMNGGKFHVDKDGNVTANSFVSNNPTITGGTLTGSQLVVDNGKGSTVTVEDGKIIASNTPSNQYYNLVYNSEFDNRLGFSCYGWKLSVDYVVTKTAMTPTLGSSSKLSLLNTSLATNAWTLIAQSDATPIIDTNTAYSMSCAVDILSDTPLGVDTITATIAFFDDKGDTRTTNVDVKADITKKDTFQTLVVKNVKPDANAKYVAIQFWIHTTASGTSAHINWTQPYITPYADIGDYIPDSVSSNQQTLINDGYIRFPMVDSISKGDYNYNTPYYISDGVTTISNDGLSLFKQSRFLNAGNWSVNYYNLDVNYQSISLTQHTFDDTAIYSTNLGPVGLTVTNGVSLLRITDNALFVEGGPLGISVRDADLNLSVPSGHNFVMDGTAVFNKLTNFAGSAIIGAGNAGDQVWVRGDGNFDGNISCRSLTQTSLLSKKTNISKLDPKEAFDKIIQTNEFTYQFKDDVARGSSKYYNSFIIDDVNDVSQYTEPEEFLSEDRKGRDDGSQLAYLTAAFQYLTQRVQQLEAEVNNKGE